MSRSMPALDVADRKLLNPLWVYWSPSSENGANFGRLTSTDQLPMATIDSLPVAQFVAGQEPFVAFGKSRQPMKPNAISCPSGEPA